MTADIIPWTGDYAAPAPVDQADRADRAVARLAEWAESAQAAYVVAERLAESSFVPDQFRRKPVELAAAILAGAEAGLSPMAAMRSFDIINGQAAPRAITLRAIVQSQGHEIVLVESTDNICKMKGRRRGQSEWQEVRWTMDRARQLGLATKNNWKSQPAAMLVARATAELCRLIASDAILGIAYTAEEAADGGQEPVTATDSAAAAPASGTRRMSRQNRPAAASTPVEAEPVEAVVVEDEPVPPPVPLADPEPVTDDVWVQLATCLGDRFDPTGSMKVTEARVRMLFDLMGQARLWPVSASGQDALHAALAKRGAAHLSDLRKDALLEFAAQAFDAAAEAWEQHQEPTDA